jgi:hypothetical protein
MSVDDRIKELLALHESNPAHFDALMARMKELSEMSYEDWMAPPPPAAPEERQEKE